MKLLLDNCVPKRAKRFFAAHTVQHASEVEMSALSNGALIQAATAMGFDVLITVDQKIRYEHDLNLLPISILELDTRDSRLPALEAMSVYLPAALLQTETHRFVSLSQAGTVTCLA